MCQKLRLTNEWRLLSRKSGFHRTGMTLVYIGKRSMAKIFTRLK